MSRKDRQEPSAPKRAPIFRYYKGSQPPTQTRAGNASRNNASRRLLSSLPRFSLRKAPTYIAVLLVLSALVGNLILSTRPTFRFGQRHVELRSEEDYQQGIRGIINESVLNKNKLTFSSSSLERKIRQSYPEITDVTISLPLIGRQAIVGMQFDNPAFAVTAKNGTFIVGNEGVVLIDGVSNPSLPLIEDVSGLQYSVGSRVMTQDDVRLILHIFEEISAKGLNISMLRIGTSPRDVQVKISGDDYIVKLSFMHDLREQLGALWAVKEQLDSSGSVVSEYIDVRLAERVFVK